MSKHDYESDMASITDFVNVFAREIGVDEAKDYDMQSIKDAVARIVYKLRRMLHEQA